MGVVRLVVQSRINELSLREDSHLSFFSFSCLCPLRALYCPKGRFCLDSFSGCGHSLQRKHHFLSPQAILDRTRHTRCEACYIDSKSETGHSYPPAKRISLFRSAAILAETLGFCQEPLRKSGFNAASPNFFRAFAMQQAVHSVVFTKLTSHLL